MAPSVKLRLAIFSAELKIFQLGPNLTIIVTLVFTRIQNIILFVKGDAKKGKIPATILFQAF